MLNLLKTDRFVQSPPTQQSTSQELVLGNLTLTTYDVGGHRQVRRVWNEYFPVVDAIVFIIDVSDRKRFDEARSELAAILNIEFISEMPIMILGNKIDKYDSAGEEEVKSIFDLNGKLTGKKNFTPQGRPFEIFMCSMAYKQGYEDAFKWLSRFF